MAVILLHLFIYCGSIWFFSFFLVPSSDLFEVKMILQWSHGRLLQNTGAW